MTTRVLSRWMALLGMVSGSAAAAEVNLAKVDAAVGAFVWDGRTLSQVLPVAAIERKRAAVMTAASADEVELDLTGKDEL